MRGWARLSVGSVLALTPGLLFAGAAHAATTTVALWHMEDPGVMTDSSGNGNTGYPTAVTSVPGTSGQGYGFNGVNSGVAVGDDDSLDPGTADFSFTVHVRFTEAPSPTVVDYDLIRKGLAGTIGGDWKMEIFPPTRGGPAQAYCRIQDATGAAAEVRDSAALNDGSWHTITCAKTSTAIQVIVDGSAVTTPANLGSISNSKPVEVGQKLGGGDQYLGDMDEVSIAVGSAPGGGGGDSTSPTVTARSPLDGASGVGVSANVTATFSEAVQGVDPGSFTLVDATTGAPVSATVTKPGTSNKWVLNPAASLVAGTRYTATLTGGTSSGIRDAANNALTTTSWSFTTG